MGNSIHKIGLYLTKKNELAFKFPANRHMPTMPRDSFFNFSFYDRVCAADANEYGTIHRYRGQEDRAFVHCDQDGWLILPPNFSLWIIDRLAGTYSDCNYITILPNGQVIPAKELLEFDRDAAKLRVNPNYRNSLAMFNPKLDSFLSAKKLEI